MTNTGGSVQDFKTKPYAVKALQFTGENGRAFIEFVAELNTTNPLDGVKVRNGGKWVSVTDGPDKITLKKGDILAFEVHTSALDVMNEQRFRELHTVSKTHALLGAN